MIAEMTTRRQGSIAAPMRPHRMRLAPVSTGRFSTGVSGVDSGGVGRTVRWFFT